MSGCSILLSFTCCATTAWTMRALRLYSHDGGSVELNRARRMHRVWERCTQSSLKLCSIPSRTNGRRTLVSLNEQLQMLPVADFPSRTNGRRTLVSLNEQLQMLPLPRWMCAPSPPLILLNFDGSRKFSVTRQLYVCCRLSRKSLRPAKPPWRRRVVFMMQ